MAWDEEIDGCQTVRKKDCKSHKIIGVYKRRPQGQQSFIVQRSYLLFVFTEVIQEDILICARYAYWVLFIMRFMCTEINKNNTTTDIPDLSFKQQKCLKHSSHFPAQQLTEGSFYYAKEN